MLSLPCVTEPYFAAWLEDWCHHTRVGGQFVAIALYQGLKLLPRISFARLACNYVALWLFLLLYIHVLSLSCAIVHLKPEQASIPVLQAQVKEKLGIGVLRCLLVALTHLSPINCMLHPLTHLSPINCMLHPCQLLSPKDQRQGRLGQQTGVAEGCILRPL